MSFLHKLPLPEKFIGVLPLYIGVESALGITIINKMAGLYGILSLFTGHPLEFMQWIFYIYSILMVPFYCAAFGHILKPQVLELASVVVLFSIDTVVSAFYTLWFALQWFFNEDVTIEKVAGQDYSQSATQGYEYGWILFSSVAVVVCKVYFNLVILSFYKKLVKFNINQGIAAVGDEAELDLKNQAKWKQMLFKFQNWCYKYLHGKL